MRHHNMNNKVEQEAYYARGKRCSVNLRKSKNELSENNLNRGNCHVCKKIGTLGIVITMIIAEPNSLTLKMPI